MSGSVVVIGAGPGGLAAAILLASTGLRVKVIERPSVVGGRTSAISAGDSIRFGPDFFSFSARIGGDLCRGWSEFAELGGDGAVGSALSDRLAKAESWMRWQRFPEWRLRLRSYVWRTRQGLALPRGESGQAPTDGAVFGAPFLGWRDIFNVQLLKMLPMLRPHQSIDTYLKRFFRDPRIRLAFSFQSKYLGIARRSFWSVVRFFRSFRWTLPG
jgi:phytoene desaturase